MLGPAAVDQPPLDPPVGTRQREPVRAQQAPEPALQSAEGQRHFAVDDRAQLRRAGGIGTPAQDRLDVIGGELVADPGLVEGPGEGIDREHRGQIDHRPRGRRHRDSAPEKRVPRVEPTPDPHSLNAPLNPRQHLRPRHERACHQPQQICRGQPTQQRPLPTSPDRRQIPSLHARRPMPHAVDAAMLAKKRAGRHASLDLAIGDPGRHEVRAPHDPVCPAGEPREFALRRVIPWSHHDQ